VRVYRVFPHDPTALAGQPGHAEYVPMLQGGGRLDNPGQYSVRYFAESPAGAVGERFGELAHWVPAMFRQPSREGRERRLALATFELPASVRILDLDDAAVLLERDLRPTDVVRRNPAVTRAWALRIHQESSGRSSGGSSARSSGGTSGRGGRRWDGVRWWSWYRAEWPIVGIWDGAVELLDVQPLTLSHPSVHEAAGLLARVLGR
jgi:hypothetical protein